MPTASSEPSIFSDMKRVYRVSADPISGAWYEAEPAPTVYFASEAEWHAQQDTEAVHYDTYEHEGETRLLEVVWDFDADTEAKHFSH